MLEKLYDISSRCISNTEQYVSTFKSDALVKSYTPCDINMKALAELNIDEEVHTDDLQLQLR